MAALRVRRQYGALIEEEEEYPAERSEGSHVIGAADRFGKRRTGAVAGATVRTVRDVQIGVAHVCAHASLSFKEGGRKKKSLATTYSPAIAVPSALKSLTSVFGMGTGVPSSL